MSKEFKISPEFAQMSEQERVQALNTNAEEVFNSYTYFRDLSDEEIFEKMEKVNQLWSEQKALEEERKIVSDKIKPIKKSIDGLQGEVSTKQLEFCEQVWKVNNFETRMIEFINSRGEIVREIRMRGGVQMKLDSAVNE